MAKKRKTKRRIKITHRVDPTHVPGKRGLHYQWTVLRGTEHLEDGICRSYSEADREGRESVRRHEEAEITGDRNKAKKRVKLGTFLNPELKRDR
jgi:hypothetical protein